MRGLFLSLYFLIAAGVVSAQQAKVFYVPMAEGSEISSNPITEYKPTSNLKSNRQDIKVYTDVRFQTLKGLGGCFNEIGGEALSKLNAAQQQEVIKALFDRESGAGLEYCRMSVGSSDFGIDAYSFSEEAGDYKMEHFSMDREKKYMFPYIKQAVDFNPNIKIFGSPWSPPGWMKHSGYMDRGVEFPEKNMLIDDPKIYKAYALYFAKYVEAYEKEGIDIDRILIQNEQDVHTKYPSCRMPAEQMAKFVQGYLRPTFKKRKVDAEIWAGTFRTAGELEGVKFASNPKLTKGFDGIGIQYTRSEYIADIKSHAPTLPIMHTECNCFNGLNNVDQARTRLAEVATYINGGCENYSYWNMILNETGKSGWDWRQNAMITIDRDAKKVIYNPDFAAISLISRYLKPNSVRIAAFSRETLISVEHDGKVYLLVQNDDKKVKNYKIDLDGEIISAQVPAQAVCAIEISK